MALLFWQGGFLFYSSVVVSDGTEELGSKRRQGFITRRVTHHMNLAGAVALVPMGWDLIAAGESQSWRKRTRWFSWVILAATLISLAWLHLGMDDLLDPKQRAILDREAFTVQHRAYLWISTLQWTIGLIYLGATLWSWRDADFQSAEANGKNNTQEPKGGIG